jgi:uncharacterized protein
VTTTAPPPIRSPRPPRDAGWRVLLRPVRPARSGTMPAGLVLVVIVGALILAMFANADATLRKSQAKRNNPTWRTTIARDVADVSDFLHLTQPRRDVDDAMGRHSSNLTAEQVLARTRAAQAAAAKSAASHGSPSTTAPSAVPHLRTPTPAAPLKLWVGGDSVTETFGTQLVRVSKLTGLFTPTLDFHIGTGLDVPSYFNWPVHLAQDVIPKVDPDVVVIMFGTNDGQNIQMPNGQILTAFTPEWQAEYERRVGAVMDLLKSPTNDRIVMWAGPPPMGPETRTHGMDMISHVDWLEAKSRPWVHYVDTWVYFSDANLQFQHSLPSATGEVRGLRQKDDIHMSDIGGTRLSWIVLRDLGTQVDLKASEAQPDPNDLPPPSIKERAVVPEHVPGAL